MPDFNNLESLYKHVEGMVLTKRNFYQIRHLFETFRDTKQNENNLKEAAKAQWEIHFLSFVVKEGQIEPESKRTDQNGQVFAYPHLDSFNEEIYEYLTRRLDATNHPKLKAQYAQVLWCSPKKHKRFAKIAVDSYLKLISIYEQEYDKDKHMFAQEISDVAINAYSIARQINDNVEELKAELRCHVQKFSLSAPFAVRNIIQFMLKPKQGFTRENLDGLENVCWQIAESLTGPNSETISFLTLGQTVDRKLNKQSYNWIQRIAQQYEAQMIQFEKAPLLASDYCMKAIENYRKIGDGEKVKALEHRFSEFRDSVEFASSQETINLTETVKTWNT